MKISHLNINLQLNIFHHHFKSLNLKKQIAILKKLEK